MIRTRLRPILLASATIALIATVGSNAVRSRAAEPPKAAPAPTQETPAATKKTAALVSEDDAKVIAAFETRVKDYLVLHRKHEATLPNLPKGATPEQIDKGQRALGALIKTTRQGAKRGEFFTPAMQAYVKRVFGLIFVGSEGKLLKASIMDENPGVPTLAVNERYPDDVPLSTMPPDVLMVLPKLEEDIEYRFIGDRPIIFDTHAHIIVDSTDEVLPK